MFFLTKFAKLITAGTIAVIVDLKKNFGRPGV